LGGDIYNGKNVQIAVSASKGRRKYTGKLTGKIGKH